MAPLFNLVNRALLYSVKQERPKQVGINVLKHLHQINVIEFKRGRELVE